MGASLIARDLTRAESGWVIKPGDTSWDEAGRPFNLRMDQHPAVREGNAPVYLRTNVFGGYAYMLDADGARQEEQFGADVLADECASRRRVTSYPLAAMSQMTTKPRVGNNATTSKFGRMTLPAYGLAEADWTHSHRRWRNRPFAERGETQAWSTAVK